MISVEQVLYESKILNGIYAGRTKPYRKNISHKFYRKARSHHVGNII